MGELLDKYAPRPDAPFDLRRAGHAFRRIGLGASLDARTSGVAAGVDAAVAAACHDAAGDDVDDMLEATIAADDIGALRGYRMWRLLRGKRRLAERMSLLWHDHFATSNQKLGDPPAMARQFAVFDEHGLGRFDDLVRAIARDPAMLRWLDNDTNVAGSPNENFARELLELFTLGRGHYSEQDVKEAARAFTGWHVRDGKFRFVGRKHDRGVKEVLGERGKLDGDDVISIALSQPASARFVAHKLLTWFVHPEPVEAEVDAVAAAYTASGRDIGAVLRTLLTSELFFGERALRSQIKSPVEFVVGCVRSLGATASPRRIARAAANMGQCIAEPPNVAGWPGGRAWLNPATWLLRSNFAAELGSRYRLEPELGALVASVDDAVERLLDGSVAGPSREALAVFDGQPAAAIVQAVLNLPEAQLQ